MNALSTRPTVLITGGTGMIGTVLTRMLLEKDYRVIILSRASGRKPTSYVASGSGSTASIAGSAPTGPETFHWDPATGAIDPGSIPQADYIVHLSGAGVADRRWSAKRKKEIVESRTKSSALLIKALQEMPNKVQAIISSSATGWYGPDPSIPNPHPFEETGPVATDFLGETCRQWEESISPVTTLGKRLVIIRTGIVLSRKGGALAEFKKPVRLGLAAILGSGRQMISWIHVEDLCRIFIHAIEQKEWSGIYNAVAPKPVDNRTLTLELARRLKGRYFVPVYIPSFLLKWLVGEMSIEVLKSVTVSAQKTRQAGFQFIYPSIETALTDLTDR